MPFVQVHWWEGRTDEQKAELVRRWTDAICEVAGADSRDVEIIFYDKKPNDWSRNGCLFEPLA